MTRPLFIRLAALVLALLVHIHVARAEAPAHLQLSVKDGLLSEDALRRALEGELGIPVIPAHASSGGGSLLELRDGERGHAVLRLTDAQGHSVEREVPLQELGPEGVEAVALLASNLVRDEAAGLLRALVSSEPAARSTEPSTTMRSARPPACAPVSAPLGLDLLPYVGSSSPRGGRDQVRGLSLNLVAGLARGLRGLELAGALNIEREFACGLQLAGAANVVMGPVRGAQLALFNLALGSFKGISLGVVGVATGEITGVQLGVINVAATSADGSQGAQFGVLNAAGGDLRGVQLGVANLNVGSVWGAEVGVGNAVIGDLHGLAFGTANLVTGDVYGAQIGVVNIAAGEARGLQLGVVNYATRASVPIGLLSIVRRGATSLELWAPSETGVTMAGVTHGNDVVHNLYQVGLRTGPAGERLVFGLGLGVRVFSRSFLRVDLDAVMQHVIRDPGEGSMTLLPVLRAPFTFMLKRGVGLMIAPSYQVMISTDAQEKTQAHLGKHVFREGRTRVTGWPGIAAGLRIELSSAR